MGIWQTQAQKSSWQTQYLSRIAAAITRAVTAREAVMAREAAATTAADRVINKVVVDRAVVPDRERATVPVNRVTANAVRAMAEVRATAVVARADRAMAAEARVMVRADRVTAAEARGMVRADRATAAAARVMARVRDTVVDRANRR